ncbi:MAG: TadE/TadG family type IV pilus assembly protein [Planctomycetota bacterium]
MKRKSRNFRCRRGAATVEFAVCLPVVVLIVFGSIEAASMLFLRQTMIQSSYEAAKVAILAEGTTQDALAAGLAVADGRNLEDVQITFDPTNIESVPPGDLITITASAPGDSNSLIPFGPFQNRTVSASAVMVKE